MSIENQKEFNKMIKEKLAKVFDAREFQKEYGINFDDVVESLNKFNVEQAKKEVPVQVVPVQEASVQEVTVQETTPQDKKISWIDEPTNDAQENYIEEIIMSEGNDEEFDNPPPYINFVTFNRLGLTVKNLSIILESKEYFQLNIIDCNSKDNSWDYIKTLNDKRIKTRTRLKKNLGPIYVLNYALTKRKPNQYFFTIDSDTYIKTDNWISRFIEVFQAFPEVGVLGLMRDNPYPRFLPPIIPRVSGDISYLELKNGVIDGIMDFIPGQLQCLRPELIEKIGYWCEEIGYGDAELSPRVKHYTDFTVGFITTVEIDMTQTSNCDTCDARHLCTLSKSVKTCYDLSKQSNKNESFARKFKWKYYEIFKELEDGKRTAYCASIHDAKYMREHPYKKEWALENFQHYIDNSN